MLQVVRDDADERAEGYAPIRNMALFDGLIGRLVNSPSHLPRLGVMSGPSGLGKSWSAARAAVKHRAVYIECRSSWTKRALPARHPARPRRYRGQDRVRDGRPGR
jgi:hypothetical protein